PLGEVLDFRRGVEGERPPQFLRIRIVPGRIERARVAYELVNPHPAGEVVFLGEIADPRQDADGIGDGIEAKDADRSAVRSEQAQDVLDERGLARAVGAHQAVHRSARQGQAHRGQGRLGTEAARQFRHADDRFTHPRATAYSLRIRKKARTYPSASITSKPHRPSSINDNSFTNEAPRCLNSSNSESGSKV